MIGRLALLLATIAVLVAFLSAAVIRPDAASLHACTGGFYGPLEHLAQYPNIFLAEAVSVGDNISRAPTLTPTFTSTATPGSNAARTPIPTPPSPPDAPFAPPTASTPFDVSGYGATLRVLNSYTGDVAGLVELDWVSRGYVERAAREQDGGLISSCAPGQFSYRYQAGQQYLVFAGEFEQLGLTTFARFQLDGTDVVVHDPDVTYFSMTADTWRRFFTSVPYEPFENSADGNVTADRVPLASVLRAVAYLRNDPRIYPPDTGSAGLFPATDN